MATRSTIAADGSMDLLCDTLMVEEILPRLQPKDLLRIGAASRRYNAVVLGPDFAARYWRRPRAGVFFQPRSCSADPLPRFLSGGQDPATTELVSGADLSFLPGPSAREKALDTVVIMHSTGGLLLCSRGRVRPVQFYACNPVTCQWVALPELLCPPASLTWSPGILRVDDTDDESGVAKRFEVVLFDQPVHQYDGTCFALRLFSSDTGKWEAMRLHLRAVVLDAFLLPPILGHSGTAYWIRCQVDKAITYIHSVQMIQLPDCLTDGTWKMSIGERPGGGLRYAHSNSSVFEVWDTKEIGNDIMWMLVYTVLVLRNYWNEIQKQMLQSFVMMKSQLPLAPDILHHWPSTQLMRMSSSSICMGPYTPRLLHGAGHNEFAVHT